MNQERINQTATTVISQDEHYWKQQVERCKASGLNRKAFCRNFDLNYNRFQYWYRKFQCMESAKPPANVVPIKLKPNSKPKPNLNPPLCSLQLQTGVMLYVHDMALVKALIQGVL